MESTSCGHYSAWTTICNMSILICHIAFSVVLLKHAQIHIDFLCELYFNIINLIWVLVAPQFALQPVGMKREWGLKPRTKRCCVYWEAMPSAKAGHWGNLRRQVSSLLEVRVRRPTRMMIAEDFSCGLVLRKNVRGSLFWLPRFLLEVLSRWS